MAEEITEYVWASDTKEEYQNIVVYTPDADTETQNYHTWLFQWPVSGFLSFFFFFWLDRVFFWLDKTTNFNPPPLDRLSDLKD